jgi:small multidrug resistance pump
MTQFVLSLMIVITVGLNTLAQTLLKLGAGSTPLNPYLFGGLIAYGVSTIFYIAVLGKFNLSIAYPVVIGLTVIAATFSGSFFLHEKVLTGQWIGIGLMISGIAAIAFAKIATP